MSGQAKCPDCGRTDVELDEVRGLYCCGNCGTICGESKITTEIQFSRSGDHQVLGGFVSAKPGGSQGGTNSLTKDKGYAQVAKFHKILHQIAGQLNLGPAQIDSAKHLYNLVLENQFTQGRNSRLIAGALLYIVCRMEKIPHMLIDFSDVLSVSLYALAAYYVKVVQKLRMADKIQEIDPSLFIHRFCSKLEFGDKERDVALTALRLMQSFKRDWITQGRRPAGLCGAAIRIAASVHGFKRSTKQIINVVKVCEETVKKRIEEFKETPMAALTQQAFEAIDFEKISLLPVNPPSFTKRKDVKFKELMSSTKVKQQLENAASEIDHELQQTEGGHNKDQPHKAVEDEKAEEESAPQEEVKESPTNQERQIAIMEPKAVKVPDKKALVRKSETLSDIDDAEVEPYLLTDKEVELKTVIWKSLNKEWIDKQLEKKPAKKTGKREPSKKGVKASKRKKNGKF